MKSKRRLKRESDTIHRMIALYCARRHQTNPNKLCPDCQELASYALRHIERCPFGKTKPTCAQCRIHCYQPQKREEIRQVMRFAGPRMLIHAPLMTIQHMLDSLRFHPE